ncbi:hypothetical protein F2Q69_00004156 [Brassica cretica]|uniref:Uncharacterized protein n=1 Tax=Brassica cretica TaxID=69181 RepID=A0A8S9NQK4_BRACR|nr:hypothetical protein F2Q69_00004156 [Brassica cretica]
MFLGIFRGTTFLGNSRCKFQGRFRRNFRGLDHRKFPRNIPRKSSLGIFRGTFRRSSGPRSFLGNSVPRNSVGNFRGISEEK